MDGAGEEKKKKTELKVLDGKSAQNLCKSRWKVSQILLSKPIFSQRLLVCVASSEDHSVKFSSVVMGITKSHFSYFNLSRLIFRN